MKPKSRSIVLRRLVRQLRASRAGRGVDLNEGVAELILADRINEVAGLLRVSDQHAMRTYSHDDAIKALADVCARAREQHDVDLESASPMLLPLSYPATVIGSLAVSCQAASTASARTHTTTAIIDETAAIVRIAGAIARAGDGKPVILDAETAVVARSQLVPTVAHLSTDDWHLPGHRGLPRRP